MFVEEFEKGCKQKCSFCEEQKADAVWLGGEKEIYICKKCAMNYLPQLMADAIVGGTSERMFKSKGATSEITKENLILERFHSAFSGALIRKFRNNRKD